MAGSAQVPGSGSLDSVSHERTHQAVKHRSASRACITWPPAAVTFDQTPGAGADTRRQLSGSPQNDPEILGTPSARGQTTDLPRSNQGCGPSGCGGDMRTTTLFLQETVRQQHENGGWPSTWQRGALRHEGLCWPPDGRPAALPTPLRGLSGARSPRPPPLARLPFSGCTLQG